jgi:hypothetical protein
MNRLGCLKVNGFIGMGMSLLLVSCVSFTPPYQNFQDIHRMHIGRKVNDPGLVANGFVDPVDFVKVVRLPNGHDEYYHRGHYRGHSTCLEIYEVDPETLIIVGFRWEGTEKDCGIVP